MTSSLTTSGLRDEIVGRGGSEGAQKGGEGIGRGGDPMIDIGGLVAACLIIGISLAIICRRY